ncbi:MAG: methyltransferase domain-containing protein [Wenzhouxiangella sp.]|nr:MAG: methyltransferase domain-containing protein [Wenzhouxiangella sp.]
MPDAIAARPARDDSVLTALHQERLEIVRDALVASGARRVMDLGCGSGALLSLLLAEPRFERILAMDASATALQVVRGEVLAGHADHARRVELIHGSWTEAHTRCVGYQAAALVETIEHLDPRDLSRMERTVFEAYQLGCIILTTPNGDYNSVLGMAPGEKRDPDHRFEWPRARFRKWCRGIAGRNGYTVGFAGIGDEDPDHGTPTQMATFRKIQDRPSAA